MSPSECNQIWMRMLYNEKIIPKATKIPRDRVVNEYTVNLGSSALHGTFGSE